MSAFLITKKFNNLFTQRVALLSRKFSAVDKATKTVKTAL